MPPHEPFLLFTEPLEEQGLRYMVSGSVAAIYYGEPRLTNDVDIVLWLTPEKIDAFIRSFPPEEFYCPPKEVILEEMARRARGHCNLIHHNTGFKADLYLVRSDPLHLWGLSRTREGELDDRSFKLAPPEYVIVRKLQFFKEGGSGKHLRDIHRILLSDDNELDRETIGHLVREHSLEREWNAARDFKG